MDYLLGASLAGLAALLLSIPAIVVELADRKHKINLPLLVDIRQIFGRKITHTEMFWIALLIHLLLGTLFGLVYQVFIGQGWIEPYTPFSMLIFAVLFWLVVGAVLFPIIGFGIFAVKEGRWVWLEVLITYLLIGAIMLLGIDWFRPFFFQLPV